MRNQDAINRARAAMLDKLSKTMRGAAISTFNQIIKDEVVDTGRLRGNWQVTLNTPAAGTIDSIIAQNVTGTLGGYKLEDTMYLTNNLPYAARIENGWSKKKGSGMVALRVQQAQAKIKSGEFTVKAR